MDIIEQLEEKRTEMRKRKGAFAEMLGIPRASYSHLLSGKLGISKTWFSSIAGLLGMSVAEVSERAADHRKARLAERVGTITHVHSASGVFCPATMIVFEIVRAAVQDALKTDRLFWGEVQFSQERHLSNIVSIRIACRHVQALCESETMSLQVIADASAVLTDQGVWEVYSNDLNFYENGLVPGLPVWHVRELEGSLDRGSHGVHWHRPRQDAA